MRYFLDTEFNGFGGALVAIALVPEDKALPPFYAALPCADPVPWVRDHVLPMLRAEPIDRAEAARRLACFLASDPEPEIVADWPEDIAHAAALLTDGAGHRPRRGAVRFTLIAAGSFASDLFSAAPHDALADAIGLRDWVQASEAGVD